VAFFQEAFYSNCGVPNSLPKRKGIPAPTHQDSGPTLPKLSRRSLWKALLPLMVILIQPTPSSTSPTTEGQFQLVFEEVG
jgi:hypothetical protein